jgi:hypothetical protein
MDISSLMVESLMKATVLPPLSFSFGAVLLRL